MFNETIHLFLNPAAGRGRAGKRRARITEILGAQDIDVSLHESKCVGDLEQRVRQQVEDGCSRLVVAGGDGSIHEAVNGILSTGGNAALGVIPTGTGNDFAKAAGIPLDWEHATQLLATRMAANAPPRPIDAGRCNERFFANGAGIGFDAEVTRIARSIKWPIGDIVYLVAIFRSMLDGIATPRARIHAGEFTWDGPLTLANLSNGPWVGGMFHIAPMASNSDGVLELLLARPVTRRRIVVLLPKLMRGTHLDEDDILHQRVTQMSVEMDEPVASHLDGEVQPMQKHFKLEVLPNALSLL
ncbi:MAG: diacylglycerol kinase family lipid kinase [Gammaproteobacteria bacterium]|nr:diacylglycerol kinase family lipid kinase [Gammaproteobacteria bacterium]